MKGTPSHPRSIINTTVSIPEISQPRNKRLHPVTMTPHVPYKMCQVRHGGQQILSSYPGVFPRGAPIIPSPDPEVSTPDTEEERLELQLLGQLLLPSWKHYRSKTRALRPERPEFKTLAQACFADTINTKWDSILRCLRSCPALLNNGGTSVAELHFQLCQGRPNVFGSIRRTDRNGGNTS